MRASKILTTVALATLFVLATDCRSAAPLDAPPPPSPPVETLAPEIAPPNAR